MKLTDTKIIISGSTLEAYLYIDREISYDFKVKRSVTRIEVIDEVSRLKKIESREKGMRRAKSKLRRIINANAWKWVRPDGQLYLPVFVTLTFRENIKNIKDANPFFTRFIKNLTYHITHDKKSCLKYVVVTEFQDRGAIHYHVIFFNLDFITGTELALIWEQGFAHIIGISNVTNVGAYVCKYMAKGFEDDRLDGKKRYFISRGLKKVVLIREQFLARDIFSRVPHDLKKYESEFHDPDGNTIKYIQYQIDRKRSFVEVIPELRHFL
jgi:hypothetical protein